MTHIKSVEEFDSLIKTGKVLVDFYADWCGPCKMLSPVIEEVEKEVEITVLKVNVDELPDLARRFGIMAIPTLFLYKDGKIEKNITSYLNKNQLLSFIEK